MQERISGIYIIENIRDGKMYIGSSSHIPQRISSHKRSLRRGDHQNNHLQRAWNKYGKESFRFKIVERCPVEKLIEQEQSWLDAGNGNLYNIAIAADAPMRGRKMPEEGRTRISEALTGHKRTERECQLIREHASRNYPAFIHKSGEITPEGWNLERLCKRKGLHTGSMWDVVHGHNHKTHKGWMLFKQAVKQPDGTWGIKRKIRAGSSYPSFIHVSGEIIPAGSDLAQLCRKMNLSRPHMISVKTGNRPLCQGWMLKSQAKQSADGTWFVEHGLAGPYPSFVHKDERIIPAGINISRMCRKYNLSVAHIMQVAGGEKKSHMGWRLLE